MERVQIEGNQTGPEAPQTEQPSAAPERPAGLPEKFQSVDDLVKSYSELEKRLSQGQQQQPTPQQEQPQAEQEAPQVDPQSPQGISLGEAYREFVQNGAVSQSTLDTLAKAGLPVAEVQAYIDGQEAVGERFKSEVLQSVGGEEAYGQMIEWAKANLSESEQRAFDQVVTSGDPSVAKMAIAGLHARFKAAGGAEPTLIDGATGNVEVGFLSWPQVTAAMRDPRYAKDEAYRAEVERKLKVSKL